MSQRSNPPPTAPLLSLASVTPKANFLKRKERKPLACPALGSARICCPQTNHLPSGSNDWVLDRRELGLGHARPWPHSFLRRYPLQTKKSLKPYSTHILPGHAIPRGW